MRKRIFQHLQNRLQLRPGNDCGEPPILRKHHHRHVRYRFVLHNSHRKSLPFVLAAAVLGAVFLFSAAHLLSYGLQYMQHQVTAADLRAMYYAEDEVSAAATEAPPTEMPAVTPSPVLATTPSPTPVSTAAVRLPQVSYPDNAYSIINARFYKIRRQNEDIIGWLTIGDLIDEAVVQRDNTFYLDRDYKGYHNVNGAIFLDERISLRTRPYTLLLYGHNMKSGLMFGGLRNFENPSYYRNSPFITFDTAYEDGRYVIFAVCTISTDARHWRYVNFAHLLSVSIPQRSQGIASLTRFSVYNSQIDVQPEDQLLLLITCTDESTDRRIVAARRIREGESEAELLALVKKTRLK